MHQGEAGTPSASLPFMLATTPIRARSLAVLLVALLAPSAGCQNQVQAPEAQGPEGAALNVGLGAAVAPLHRAATGCYTPCAYGTTCDEASGTCVSRECTAGEPGCGVPPRSAVTAGAPADGAPLATPVCTPACLADQMCVVEGGLSVCRAPGSGGPPAAPPPGPR